MTKNREQVLANYYSPSEFINAHRPSKMPQPVAPSQPVIQPPTPPSPVQPAPASPTPAQPAQVPQPQIAVDSQRTDPATGRFRKARTDNWYSAPVGAFGSTLWCYASTSQEINWGEWQPNLPAAGQYEVQVFIPDQYATTRQARYRVVHADGQSEVTINQDSISNKWVRLGSFRFVPGQGSLRLSDVTGESQQGVMIAFDAVRWVKVS
jgi:hypothetical protein